MGIVKRIIEKLTVYTQHWHLHMIFDMSNL